ncbi:hypothetical protein H6F67_26215 [Microcoleus sp. FACHB-1515]|uniref:hypothetical protein n=1 Tax=Cyanophyceae TaxID=3028117 RepID=UPI001687013D|nr:hypothetical protein [Microcoleus sp. FACHB-1515]MBD2093344.1 hypothetical protein [Microcoleus sp. FACHB-1515]
MDGNCVRRSSTVADRINVDIEGLRDRIDKAHASNPLWSKLSMAQKLRQLVEDALSAIEQEKGDKA